VLLFVDGVVVMVFLMKMFVDVLYLIELMIVFVLLCKVSFLFVVVNVLVVFVE